MIVGFLSGAALIGCDEPSCAARVYAISAHVAGDGWHTMYAVTEPDSIVRTDWCPKHHRAPTW